ncbi:DUF7305 domain-containing protein [Dehalococcoides mccartyi]|uniref:DUF7305 domain-containing protein n=1 Tax=Dehalococcoides mccartyi TaxID=61435 RepID=UPI0006BD747A|nr:hypothetical protein [Dehalococcoides mccartyi]QYY57696.1 hypothetical protein CWV2_000942 [Dehalococcoides mccartyi]BAS32230.1 hypothetical protein IBK_1188 [Dehalococcoides mccartyi IBARAKI]
MIGIKKLIKGEKGASLAIALIFLAIGAIMLPPLLMLIGSGLQQGTAIEERTAGIYDSDAGVEWAINLIKTGGEGVTDAYGNIGLPNEQDSIRIYNLSDLNGSTVEVTLTYHGKGYYTVDSKASLNGKSITTQATLKYQLSGGGLFDNAITALNGDIEFAKDAFVTSAPGSDQGNIIANGNINIGRNTVIEGSAIASGSITGFVGYIEQGYYEDTPVSFPTLDTSIFMTKAMIASNGNIELASNYITGGTITVDTRLLGNLSPNNNKTLIVNGNLYIEGSFSSSKDFSFEFGGEALYIGGNLDFSKNAEVKFTNPNGCTIYVAGEIKISKDIQFDGPYTLVANGDIYLAKDTSYILDPTKRPPLIISEMGTIDVSKSDTIVGILYAPNGNIIINKDMDIEGCVIARGIEVKKNLKITFRTDWNLSELDTYLNGGLSTLNILAWNTIGG